ncbi:MAG: hypothetical protein QOD39_1698 [Mycobacterium sp.]|nr:hypothetical protein [Mycobacterium sp.]
MWNTNPAAMLVAAATAVALASAPIALAQECDPTASVCEGDVGGAPPAGPAPVSAAEQYPLDEDWYFNPAGGGTELQPNHPSGGGSAGGGGHH